MNEPLYKLGHFEAGERVEYVHPNTFCGENMSNGQQRLRIAPAGNQIDLITRFLEALPEPFAMLFVLVVSRSQLEAGRYQSPLGSREIICGFLDQFRDLFERDGRANLWIASLPEDQPIAGQIVYDRHNIIYAYGPLEKFESILSELGIRRSEPHSLPSPHVHRYHNEFDSAVDALMDYCEWSRSPLLDSDDD